MPTCTELFYHAFQTELGPMLLALGDRGVRFLHFGPSESSLRCMLRNNFPLASLAPCSAQHQHTTHQVESVVRRLLTGDTCEEHLPFDLQGTPFQHDVWRYLQTIPNGELRSYSDVAQAIGRPRAVRAAASACARNNIALLIPCHRIIRGDGYLGGYRWGLDKKASLLKTEERALHKRLKPTTTA